MFTPTDIMVLQIAVRGGGRGGGGFGNFTGGDFFYQVKGTSGGVI